MNKGAAITGLLTWIAGGAAGLVATIALAYTASTSASLSDVSTKVSTHDTEIALLRQSSCIQNENMINLGKRLQIAIVSDPSCSK